MTRRIAAATEQLNRDRAEARRLIDAARPLWRSNRKKALTLDNRACRICGFALCLEVHHIIPVAQGGSDKLGNLITLCPNHHAMADRNLIAPEEFAKHLDLRTSKGRRRAAFELCEHVARVLDAAGSDRQKIEEAYETLKVELPNRLALLYGPEAMTKAMLDLFPPLPPASRGDL